MGCLARGKPKAIQHRDTENTEEFLVKEMRLNAGGWPGLALQQQQALTEQQRRLLLRNRVKDANKKLSGAAQEAGVRSEKFGIFHDAGYKGLYGGLGMKDIKKTKGISEKDDLLDCIGRPN